MWPGAVAPSVTASAPWAGPSRPPSWACSLHPPLKCACSPGLAPSPSICSPGQAPPLRGLWLRLHIPGLLARPDPLPRAPEPTSCLHPGVSTWPSLSLSPSHPDPSSSRIPCLRTASPATPAPELELGVIQRTVILDTSLSPPHGIGHQLLWISLQRGSQCHPSHSPAGSIIGQDLAPLIPQLPPRLPSSPSSTSTATRETFLKQSLDHGPPLLRILPWLPMAPADTFVWPPRACLS